MAASIISRVMVLSAMGLLRGFGGGGLTKLRLQGSGGTATLPTVRERRSPVWDLEKILTVSAAWVQALGSIIALFVAFKVASRQSARDDRRRQLDAESWRSGLYDIAVEAQLLAQLAAVPKDRATGEAFAAAYDVMHARTIVALLTARIKSDRIDAKDVKPAVKVLAEFSRLHAIFEAYLPRLRAGQFLFEMREEAFARFERISLTVSELKPAGRAAPICVRDSLHRSAPIKSGCTVPSG